MPTVIAPFLQASDLPPLTLDPLEPLAVFAALPAAELVAELLELLLPQALKPERGGDKTEERDKLGVGTREPAQFVSFHDARMCSLRVHGERNR